MTRASSDVSNPTWPSIVRIQSLTLARMRITSRRTAGIHRKRPPTLVTGPGSHPSWAVPPWPVLPPARQSPRYSDCHLPPCAGCTPLRSASLRSRAHTAPLEVLSIVTSVFRASHAQLAQPLRRRSGTCPTSLPFPVWAPLVHGSAALPHHVAQQASLTLASRVIRWRRKAPSVVAEQAILSVLHRMGNTGCGHKRPGLVALQTRLFENQVV
jgi:hypothetical protein